MKLVVFRAAVGTVLAGQCMVGMGSARVGEVPDETLVDVTASQQSVTVIGAGLSNNQTGLNDVKNDTLDPPRFTAGPLFGGGVGGGRGTPGDRKRAQPTSQDDSQRDCANSTGNPVILTTGEKHKDEHDFVAAGDYGLGLRRTYRSMNATGTMFGAHWPSSLEHPKLTFSPSCTPWMGWCAPATVTLAETDGTKYRYGGSPGDDGIYYYSVNGAAATGELLYIVASKRWVLRK